MTITVHPLCDTADGPTLAEDINEIATLQNIAGMWLERAGRCKTEKAQAEARHLWEDTLDAVTEAQLRLRDRMFLMGIAYAETPTHRAHIHPIPETGAVTAVVTAKVTL